MKPERLIVFVEEYSMEAALEMLLPEMMGNVEFQIIRFQCKDELLKKLPSRLNGLGKWLPESWSILVLVDRDDDDCIELKRKLESYAEAAGLLTKTKATPGQCFKVTNRIVIEELESWYFGDWAAVKTAYPKVPDTIPQQAPYRDPDSIKGGTWETFERIMKKAGYFSTGLRKVECAREITRHMNFGRNQSNSFSAFYSAVMTILSGSAA